MSDNNDNVIDFFKRQQPFIDKSTSDDLIKGKFPYIKLTKDGNGNYYSKESLREYSQKVCYIITIIKESMPSIALYKYKVPQPFLKEFLNKFSIEEIVEIEKYIPDDLA